MKKSGRNLDQFKFSTKKSVSHVEAVLFFLYIEAKCMAVQSCG